MEPMKQCPNCGKYVAADKTYCMSCGTTLGVKCPDCGKVVPMQTKVCPCGHSFVKRSRKKTPSKVLPFIKKYDTWLLLSLVAAVLLTCVIFAFLPTFGYEVMTTTKKDTISEGSFATGFELMGYFLGGHPQSIQNILSFSTFKEITTPLTLMAYLEGLGYIVLLVCLVLATLLLAINNKKTSKMTSKRLIPLCGVTLLGGVMVFVADMVQRILMSSRLSEVYNRVGEDAHVSVTYEVCSLFPIILFALAIALFAGHMLLHLLSLKHREGQDELALSTILKFPFVWLFRRLRRLFSGKRRQKGEDVTDERSITCTKRFTTYLILLGVSLVFTQALLSKISHIFFWFVFLLPVPMLLYALVAKHALTVTMLSESATTEKNQPYVYEFDIENHSPLAFPFIEAHLSIPQANSVRCTERCVHLSMAPLSTYHMKNTVSFRFRGTYDIGVKYFYVYDFFRMFRIRVPVSHLTSVYVLPRRLSMDDLLAQAVADSTLRTVSSPLVLDRLEVSDIRDYRMGDSLKSIHWKLSSKSETFIVKEHNTGTSDQTVIFCDMAAHYPDEAPAQAVLSTLDTPKKETRAERRARIKAERAEKKMAAQRKPRKGRIVKEQDTHDISDEALAERLAQRAQVADVTDREDGVVMVEEVATPTATDQKFVDVHALQRAEYYDDMNEYLADGVVEMTIASVLAELQMGHEVTLIWYDRRSESGIFAFVLKGIEAFEQIYHLFATAPLTESHNHVTNLTAVLTELQSAKQLFVVSAMDHEMLTKLLNLSGLSDAGSFGSAEVMLYNPDERFEHTAERYTYLDGCREQLSGVGMTLRVSGMIAVRQDGEKDTTSNQGEVSA